MPGKILHYELHRTIGSGASCKVKLATDTISGRKVAIKIMNDDMDAKMKELVMTEVKAMANLQHKNIISQIEYGSGTYEKSSGKSKTVSYIVLEIALGGELFDFVAISGRFDEPLARYFFHQFMEGLDFCHQAGIAHRDLKPENLLLDQKYDLKIADFGFAAPVEGRDGSGNLTTKLGTLNYMAPEIHLKMPYQGKSVDLFAAAIILFIMVAQHPPFTTAQPQDPFYKCLAANRADIFWKTHSKNKPTSDFFSEDFKDLVQSMLQLDPNHRPSIPEVMAHAWMKGDMPTTEEVYAEFGKRDAMVKKNVEEERAAKQQEKAKRIQQRRDDAMVTRSGNATEEIDESVFLAPKKELIGYEQVFAQNTEFFSSYNPDMIEEAFIKHLRNEGIEPKVHEKKYKIKFAIKTTDQGGQQQEIKICMRILKCGDDAVCIEFQKLSGDQIRFHDHFNEFKNSVLGYANDLNLGQVGLEE